MRRISCILKTEAAVESNVDYWYFPKALFKIWNADPFNDQGHFGIIWYVFIVVTILAMLFRDKIAVSLALGCWLWMAWMQWGVQSPQGDPIAKYIRYISMIVPVQCLTFGAVLLATNEILKNHQQGYYRFICPSAYSPYMGRNSYSKGG